MIIKKMTVFAALAMSLLTSDAWANHEDACAIWLCLPSGFGQGCGGAEHEFKHRIKHGKPPLPDFMSCAIDDGSGETPNITYKDGVSALVPEHIESTGWHNEGGRNGQHQVCNGWITVKEQIIDGRVCSNKSPKYCTKTLHWVETYEDGKPLMDRYYYDI